MELRAKLKFDNFSKVFTKLPKERMSKIALSLTKNRSKTPDQTQGETGSTLLALKQPEIKYKKLEIASIYQNIEESAINRPTKSAEPNPDLERNMT
jgi:hypothetical protein